MKTDWAGHRTCFGVRLSLLATGMMLGGCLVIPVPEYKAPGSRGNITKDAAGDFLPGVTTKEEIILRLGEPDYATEDGSRLGYQWNRVKAWFFVGGPGGGGAAGEISRSYLLCLTFDEKSRFLKTDILKGWFDVSPGKMAEIPAEKPD